MPLATREALLKPAERRYMEFNLPVSGARVRIQSLHAGEKDEYEAELQLNDKGERKPIRDRMAEAKPLMALYVLVDDAGKPLLGPEDFDAITEMDGGDLAAIYDMAWKHCGFETVDLEALAKN